MDLDKKIFELIAQSSADIDEKDIKPLEIEYQKLIDVIISENPFQTISIINKNRPNVKPRFELYKLFSKEDDSKNSISDPRIVVIGDIHCDVNSLTGIFQKLNISDYNYLENAIFIFLGDYIDRGMLPFQTLKFILGFKALLKDRCILLRGNHDHINYNKADNKFHSEVKPAETVQLFNEYISAETNFKIFTFLNSLPYLSILKRNEKNILFVHASIPRDEYLELFDVQKISELKYAEQENKENETVKLLNSILWGDPSNVKLKMNGTSTRFEFGSDQFEKFMNKTSFTHIFRGHESVEFGIKEMYDRKLYTVFSSGGINNEQSYYSDSVPFPGFVIIDEKGNIIQENIFTYKILHTNRNIDPVHSEVYKYFIENELVKPYSFLIESNIKWDDQKLESENFFNNLKLNSEFAIRLESTTTPQFLIDVVKNNFSSINKNKEDKK